MIRQPPSTKGAFASFVGIGGLKVHHQRSGGEVEIYASNPGDRTSWTAEARLLDGRLLDCRFAPLTGGATLTAFRISDSTGATKPAIAEDADKRRALG